LEREQLKTSRKYVGAVVLLGVFALAFGVFGTVAPPLAEEPALEPQQDSSPDSVGHFTNPPTFDSGWVNIEDKCGQIFNITHDLNTREVFVDITGKQKLNELCGEHQRNLGGTNLIYGWTQAFGGTKSDICYSMVQTADGGFAMAGSTVSFGAGDNDFLLIKTDPAGNLLWNKTYGGGNIDICYSLIQTSDLGYALTGYTLSYGAYIDFWLVKTDPTGNTMWSKTYGGSDQDIPFSLIQTDDGGYAIAGYTNFGGVPFNAWLVKTNSSGDTEWSQHYGGTGYESANSVIQTTDGGYTLAGYTAGSYSPDQQVLLIKTNSTGSMEWSKTYGGTGNDVAKSVVQTSDGGYAIGGYGFANIIKTDADGNQEWYETYGVVANSIVQTPDGGYALAGGSGDFWFVKTNSSGNIQWSETYGGAGNEGANSMVLTGDGGFALAGSTDAYGGGADFWLIKTNVQLGLTWTDFSNSNITLYRGKTDFDWNYVRVRIWTIEEPSWIYGDINMDGVVDAKDLYILGRNYGKSVSLLSLGGIIGIAGIHTIRKRKQAN
jgi:hypothetical protein